MIKQLKITLISDAWQPQINGVVTTLRHTRQLLAKSGHEIQLLTPNLFWTVPCPTYPSIGLALNARAKLARLLEAFQPQAIHIATEGPLGLAGRNYCVRRGLHFSTSFHTRFAEYINLRAKIPIAWGYAYQRWFHAPAVQTMVATKSLETELQAKGFKNLVRWSRGVDMRLYFPREKSFLSDPRPISMYVGRVAVEKNIKAFLDLAVPGTKYVIGDGPQLNHYRKQYPSIRFTGFQSGETLAKFMAAADVFVFPSRTDTFGMVILDALASGVPVAAYPVQGPMDILADPAIGCMSHDLREAVLGALRTNGKRCRQYALNYSWEACTRQFIKNLTPALPHARG